MFYNSMEKKPVARSGGQRYLLANPSVYGLLSHCNAAIVVNCFTLLKKHEVRYV
ncbi:MAG TPA: virulence promoting factor [Franconibacter helveticus]|nr:virulence promoting factor [Franconibacter helveticus]